MLAQVPLHQPGGPLGNPGLCNTLRAVPVLHLQGLRPLVSKAGVGTRPGTALCLSG